MLYLAAITEWLRAIGSAGIGGAVILTMIIIWLGIGFAQLLRANARLRRIQGSALEKWKEQVDHINPLDQQFHGKRILIADLVHPVTKSIEGKRFTDCELIGPANLAMIGGGQMVGVTFGNCDIVVLRPSERLPVHNAVKLDSLNIIGGAIWNCTIFIPQRLIQMFVDMNATFISLTGQPEIDIQSPPKPEAERPQ